ncbi:MAG: amino acid carrier protein [Parachlamydiales bacterium]|jgi:AGCS family alanine or glycine:cation symporter
MLESFFDLLSIIDSFFWSYVAFILIMFLGCLLTIQARFFQLRALPSIFKTFVQLMKTSTSDERGVHPLKAFFASVGGMIGIGNMVGIVTAIQIGGPGALVWVWVAALIGGVIKYSEIYLGLKNRVKNDRGGYDGGPMYFLRAAFNNTWVPFLIAIMLCIYGVEIYQFAVISDSVATNFDLNRYGVIAAIICMVVYASVGGIPRVGKICSLVMPSFVVLYLVMGGWVLLQEITLLPGILKDVFVAAFSGHAAVGGFAGSSVLLAIQHGIARAAYSGDIGIGYDSIIQSESSTVYPERQARLAVLGICIDTIVCTVSILIVLLTGVWKVETPIESSQLIQTALSNYFPYMHVFMPVFIFIAGYTTMIAYFCVGIKCARFVHPKYGKMAYIIYGVCSLVFFSFFDQTQALIIMSISGAILLSVNLVGIYMLRHQIRFEQEVEVPVDDVRERVCVVLD